MQFFSKFLFNMKKNVDEFTYMIFILEKYENFSKKNMYFKI